MQTSTCSEDERPVKEEKPSVEKQQFDSPSGITEWPYVDFCRCEAHFVVKQAVGIAETMLQAGCLPRAAPHRPVPSVNTRPWPICEPKSYALDPPPHIKRIPGSQAFAYVPSALFRSRILTPASVEVAKSSPSQSATFNSPLARPLNPGQTRNSSLARPPTCPPEDKSPSYRTL